MICEHKLKLEKVEWNGRTREKKFQQPKQAIFLCVDCRSKLVFDYTKQIIPHGD